MREHFQGSPVHPLVRTVCSAAEVACTGLFLVLVASPLRAPAQHDAPATDAVLTTEQIATSQPPLRDSPVLKGNEWVVVPIPTLSPSQGFGVQVLGQYVFKGATQAEDTPASIVGIGGFYTEEKSWGLGAGYLGHWQDDKWRPMAGGGYADLHYDFYGIGNAQADYDLAVPVDQQATFGLLQLMRRIIPGLYAGLRFTASETTAASPGLSVPPFELPPFDIDVATVSAGLVAQWDTRDSQFYPTRGQYANFSANFNDGDYSYQVYQADWNGYYSFGESTVLAARVFLRTAEGDAPFYALSSFGMHNDLRGYKGGKYRDRFMFATQVEYRRKLSARWGFVVFAGVGEVAPSFSDMSGDNLLSSAGAGLRFRVAQSHPINLRLDWAYGDESCVYLGVNEAF